MKKVDASHAEFTECANKLRAASMGVQANAWADMREGAQKLGKAAALLDVFANSIRTLRDENDRLRAELEAAKEGMRALSDEYKFCNMCKYHNGEGVDTCSHPLRFSCDAENFYEWRGIPANTPAQGATDGQKEEVERNGQLEI